MTAPGVRTRLSDNQIRALSSVPGFQETTPKMSAKVPAAEYVDPARFELEKKAIFFREPFMIGPSANIPKPNMFFRQEVLGVPVLVTRGRDGVVRAFVNICRHRGVVLCPKDEPGMAPRISCPYHGWTYNLDGELAAVPREEVFEDFDRSRYNLLALPCVEAGGLIYVGLDPKGKIDFSDVTGQLATDLDGMGLAKMQVYRKHTFKIAANWKLVMDTMLDKYHVLRLHQNTLGKFFDDSPEVTEMIGPHVSSAAGRSNFKIEDMSEDFEVVRRKSVLGYMLFPTGLIVVSPRYLSLGVLRPIAHDRSEVDYFMLMTDPPKDAEAEEKLKQSFELISIAFGQEDFWAAEQGQIGLSSGLIDELLVGGLERRMVMFRDVLIDKLERYQASEASRAS
jgi:glycine betaine catabolism A